MTRPIAIIGAGLSGLACALHLHRHEVPVRLFESDEVGGRIRTFERDGFLLDRGFQVLQTSYPEARRMLDFDALDLRAFEPGALVWTGDELERISDPLRRPGRLIEMLRSPTSSFADKLRVAKLRWSVSRGPARRLLERPEIRTEDRLRELGFDDDFIERFFRPFFAGVFLEHDLDTSSRWFELLFRLFAQGDATLPARGMQRIPEQLAAQLPAETLFLGTPVRDVAERVVTLRDGEEMIVDAAVVATDEPTATGLLGREHAPSRTGRRVHCLYFAAPRLTSAPWTEPILTLGRKSGVINNLCVPSRVSPHYAPEGQDLISVTLLPSALRQGQEPEEACRGELRNWFGDPADAWRLIEHFDIEDALPPQPPGDFLEHHELQVADGIFRCGDYLETSSIHGALVSGRKTAKAVLRYLAAL